MVVKGIMKGLPENISDLEETCPICLLTKATKIPRVMKNDVSKFAPGLMIQIYCVYFNVGSIHEFTSSFLAVCSAT